MDETREGLYGRLAWRYTCAHLRAQIRALG